jgi:hypothetical protein
MFLTKANVAQLVERQLPKLDVAGSNPVIRSFYYDEFIPENKKRGGMLCLN